MQNAVAVAAGVIGIVLSILTVINLIDTIVGSRTQSKIEVLDLKNQAKMDEIRRSLNELKVLVSSLREKA
jgi:hypothetical protein